MAVFIRILTSQSSPGHIPGSDLLPLGLASQVIFHPSGAGERDLLQAEVRLEHLVGEKLGPKIGSEWGAAAEAALSLIREEDLPRCRSRANALIKDLHAEAHAYLSDVLPLGYEQRLNRFGHALKAVAEGNATRIGDLISEVRVLERHRDGRLPDHRNRKVRMSVRLARWLLESEEAGVQPSLEDCTQRYIAELSFVDWARDVLTGGDPVPELQHVYEGLSSRALQRRERFNRQFANCLADWTTAGCPNRGVIPIENVLAAIVAPAARSERVLLIVLDGMAWSVAQELLFDLERNYHWTRVQPTTEERSPPWPVLSTVPSVTEFARTSLFSGALAVGDQNEESARFPLHRELRSLCTAKYPPILFHKADIEEKSRQGISPALQKALGNSSNRVVAVVVNAVDDHLLKADQTSNTWDVNHIRLLESLLSEARASKRMVIIAADHGHIIDRQTQSVPAHGGGERWHPANRAPLESEVVLGGARIQPYQSEIIVPWSETIRYGAAKRNGYHGGVTPQELIAPCVVLAHLDDRDQLHKDWRAVNRYEPTWWKLEGQYTPAELTPLPGVSRKDEPDSELPLFAQPTSISETIVRPIWITRLLASEQFVQRRKSAGRAAPKVEEISACLEALETAGCRLATGVLAARINQPEIRIRGFVSSLQRILNVEGYKVVGYSADEGQVILDLQLLLGQFELKEIE